MEYYPGPAIFSLNATLTLPGIAGLILTVGMSIDANVIIFKELGRAKKRESKAVVDGGYQRALTTIIDANMTTVIAALSLAIWNGPIKVLLLYFSGGF